MSIASKLARRNFHSVRKTKSRAYSKFVATKAPGVKDEERWATVAKNLSHKDMKVISANADIFLEDKMFPQHFVDMVQLALFERAIANAKPAG